MAVSLFESHRPREASITVSLSPDLSGDYVADGAADEVEINAAIAFVAALGGGGEVHLGPGTYVLTGSVVMNQPDIVLEGSGWDTVLDGTAAGDHAIACSGTSDRSIIRDLQVFTVAGGGDPINTINYLLGADDLFIDHVYISQSDSIGIEGFGARTRISACRITTCDADAISIGGPQAIVEHNFISGITRDGIAIGALGDNGVVNGNLIDTVGADGIFVNADAENVVAQGNRIIAATAAVLDDQSQTGIIPTAAFQFTEAINGAIVTASPTGVDVDANTEGAVAWGQIPQEAQGITRIKIWAIATGGPIGGGGQMHVEVTFNAGASNAAYNTAAKSWTLVNFDSVEVDYVADDVVHWNIEDGTVGNELRNLEPGDSFELIVTHEAGAAPDGATECLFRVVEIEYGYIHEHRGRLTRPIIVHVQGRSYTAR